MATTTTKLDVASREPEGSRSARRLRRSGRIPGVLYGGGEPVAISIEERELRRALTGAGGLHSILDVQIDGTGTAHASILKDYQVDKVRGYLTHVDLQEVRLDQPIQSAVVIELIGESVGTKAGGVLSQVNREVRVEALPMEMPDRLELDISAMEIGDTLRLSDLPAREGVTFLDDPETVLANVTVPTRVEEPEPEEVEGEEGEEGVEGEVAEGEEGAEGAGEASAEPEGEAAGEPAADEG